MTELKQNKNIDTENTVVSDGQEGAQGKVTGKGDHYMDRKNLTANAGDTGGWVPSLSWEDNLEKEMSFHSSILACRIQWTKEPGQATVSGAKRVGHN